MDPSLQHALKGGVAPHQEYLLQGCINDNSKEILLHRLRGLCDNADCQPETFRDHEMVFNIKGAANQSMSFRLRHSLMQPDSWHLRYIGTPEGSGDKSRHTLVRMCIDVGCSENVVQFLNEMGFKMDHEYVAHGFFFHKGRMKCTVSKLFRLLQTGAVESLEPFSTFYFVELSVVAPSGQDQIGEDMKNFAEQLKPLVHLEKIEHRKLQLQQQNVT